MQERDVDLLLVDSGDLHDGEDLPKYQFCQLRWSQGPVLLTDSLLEASTPMMYAFRCEAGPSLTFFRRPTNSSSSSRMTSWPLASMYQVFFLEIGEMNY